MIGGCELVVARVCEWPAHRGSCGVYLRVHGYVCI